MPCGGRMVVQNSLPHVITRRAKHWVGDGDRALPVCFWTMSHFGTRSCRTAGCGSVQAAWQSLRGSGSERLVLSPDTAWWG